MTSFRFLIGLLVGVATCVAGSVVILMVAWYRGGGVDFSASLMVFGVIAVGFLGSFTGCAIAKTRMGIQATLIWSASAALMSVTLQLAGVMLAGLALPGVGLGYLAAAARTLPDDGYSKERTPNRG